MLTNGGGGVSFYDLCDTYLYYSIQALVKHDTLDLYNLMMQNHHQYFEVLYQLIKLDDQPFLWTLVTQRICGCGKIYVKITQETIRIMRKLFQIRFDKGFQ